MLYNNQEVTNENVDEIIDELLAHYATDRLEVAFKFIDKGLCAKSYPVSAVSESYLQLVLLCQGGESGMELKHLPYEGGIQSQPSRFFHARSVINSALSTVYEEARKRHAHHDPTS